MYTYIVLCLHLLAIQLSSLFSIHIPNILQRDRYTYVRTYTPVYSLLSQSLLCIYYYSRIVVVLKVSLAAHSVLFASEFTLDQLIALWIYNKTASVSSREVCCTYYTWCNACLHTFKWATIVVSGTCMTDQFLYWSHTIQKCYNKYGIVRMDTNMYLYTCTVYTHIVVSIAKWSKGISIKDNLPKHMLFILAPRK